MFKIDLKKYFFSYVYIVLGIISIFSYIFSQIFIEKVPFLTTHEPMPEFAPKALFSEGFILSSILYLCCNVALLLEIIMRFIFKKFSLKHQNCFKIRLSDNTAHILSIIFYVLFLTATFPYIIFIKNAFK